MTIDGYETWLMRREDVDEDEATPRIAALRALDALLACRGYSIIFQHRGRSRIEPEGCLIVVEAVQNPLTTLFIALHEVGHLLLDVPGVADVRFPHGYEAKNRRTRRHRIDVVAEEISAWDEGWRFGTSMSLLLPTDREAFDRVKYRSVATYIKWAAA